MQNDLTKFDFNTPIKCDMCGHITLIYDGVGEYRCEQCNNVMYDDYGIVRRYLEKNPGATQGQVSKITGVPTSVIRRLLKEGKIQIANGSYVFLHCERCGKDIRSGKYCDNCATELAGANAKLLHSTDSKPVTVGYEKGKSGVGGFRRYKRDN